MSIRQVFRNYKDGGNNYILKASSSNHWTGFTKSVIDGLREKYGNKFNLVIIITKDECEYYCIPFLFVEHLFTDQTMTTGDLAEKGLLRWTAVIEDSQFKLLNAHESLDISPYYEKMKYDDDIVNAEELTNERFIQGLREIQSSIKPFHLDVLYSLAAFPENSATTVELAELLNEKYQSLNTSLGNLGRKFCESINFAPLLPNGEKYWVSVWFKFYKDKDGRIGWSLRDGILSALEQLALFPQNSVFEKNIEDILVLKSAKDIPERRINRLKDLNKSRLPQTRKNQISIYVRNPDIVAQVLIWADGTCDLCKEPAPFIKPNGMPYLEVHHIVLLSKGGTDSLDNAVALCPNCHRKMHFAVKCLSDVDDLKRLSYTRATDLLN